MNRKILTPQAYFSIWCHDCKFQKSCAHYERLKELGGKKFKNYLEAKGLKQCRYYKERSTTKI